MLFSQQSAVFHRLLRAGIPNEDKQKKTFFIVFFEQIILHIAYDIIYLSWISEISDSELDVPFCVLAQEDWLGKS